MKSINELESEMAQTTFNLAKTFDELFIKDEKKALKMLTQATSFLNDKVEVILMKVEIEQNYNMGLISNEEYKTSLSRL